MTVRIIGPRDISPEDMRQFADAHKDVIDTTSRSRTWSRWLSPFVLGPVPLYVGAGPTEAHCMENAWQYAKVFPQHVGPDGEPNEDYFQWAWEGWQNPRANRYPMGKGVKPLYSLWAGEHLGYIDARKKIYVHLYGRNVIKTPAFNQLLALYRERGEITLWDFDGYDYKEQGMSLRDVVHCETRKMGHAFVLAMLLERLPT